MEIERLVESDELVLALIRLRIRPAGADAEFEQRIAHLWTRRDLKVVRCQAFLDREQALGAVGLSDRS
jgi:ketosteroid isomerase-like protein